MANEKVFQSRIQLKHDIEENWSKATNFIPKVGEIIIYDIDENNSIARFKIGDGITNVNSLPFVSHHEVISYLPQDLTEEQKAQVRENIGAGEPQIQADWNQNDETAPDYIKNRTHYEIITPLSIVESNFGTAAGYTSYKVGPYEWKANKPISLIIDGVLYEFDSYNSSGYSSMLGQYVYSYGAPYALGNITDDSEYPFTFIIISKSIDDTEEYAHIEFADDSMDHTVEIFGGIKQLDPKYVGTDWNQNDENAPGYIANRTHYIDAINGTIVPNDTYFISGTQGVTINAKKDDFKMPVVGRTYQITYGDIVTTKVAYGEDIGNNTVWLGENYNEFKMRFSFNEINSKVEVYIETASTGQKIISITGPYLNKIYQLDEKYIPTATNNDIIQMLIDTEMISPATDEFSNLLTDENNSILVY